MTELEKKIVALYENQEQSYKTLLTTTFNLVEISARLGDLDEYTLHLSELNERIQDLLKLRLNLIDKGLELPKFEIH